MGPLSLTIWNGTNLQAGSVPRTLSLRGHAGLCLDAPGNVGAGALIQLCESRDSTRCSCRPIRPTPGPTAHRVAGECNGHTNQLWLFDDGAFKIQYFADPSKCLDAGDMNEGTEIKIWECNDLDQQKWGYDYNAGTIYLVNSVAEASKCMDSFAPPTGGNKLQVWSCNGLDQQQFNVMWGTTIRTNQDYKLCLDLEGGQASPGTPVQLCESRKL